MKENEAHKSPKRIIFDTNAVMAPEQFGVDVFEEVRKKVGGYEAVVPRAVVRELERLADEEVAANVGLELVRSQENCAVEGPEEGHADDVIVDMARDSGVDGVVTNDTKLKERLLDVNVPVLYLRQRSYLDLRYP